MKILGGVILSSLAIWKIFHLHPVNETDEQSNDYFPVKSDAEIIGGHPIVGVV